MRNSRDIVERLREDVAKCEGMCGAAAIMAPNVEAELEDAIDVITGLRADLAAAVKRGDGLAADMAAVAARAERADVARLAMEAQYYAAKDDRDAWKELAERARALIRDNLLACFGTGVSREEIYAALADDPPAGAEEAGR